MKRKKVMITFVTGIIMVMIAWGLLFINLYKNIVSDNEINVTFEAKVQFTEEEADAYLKALENDLKDAPVEAAGDVNAGDIFDTDNPNMMTIPLVYTDITVGKENIKTDEKGMIIVSHTQIDEIKDTYEKYGFVFTENGSDIIARREVTFEEYIGGTCAFDEH